MTIDEILLKELDAIGMRANQDGLLASQARMMARRFRELKQEVELLGDIADSALESSHVNTATSRALHRYYAWRARKEFLP